MRFAVAAVVLAAAAALVAAVGAGGPRASVIAPSPRQEPSATPIANPCPSGTLPDRGVCIPVPAPRAAPATNAQRIPRLPERERDFSRYRWPLTAPNVVQEGAGSADGGRNLDGVSISAPPGTEIFTTELEGQDGPARVVYTGPLVGATLVTAHAVRDGDRRYEYLVVLGHLEVSPPLAPRAAVAERRALAHVGQEPLYFEVRRLRDGVDPWTLPPAQLLDDAQSVAVDPRNVLRHD